ncbi:MAG: aspartate aminotransferase family protein, partial [Pseudomonadota bacterium]
AQGRRLWHTSNLYRIPEQERLATLLVDNTFADTVFFTNSGTEAVECAVKMARKYFHAAEKPERTEIICFEGAFHGRSSAGIAAAGGAKLTDGFAPLLPGFRHVPWGAHDAIELEIGPETAAIMIEPIQGEGGIKPLPEPCLKGLRDVCDRHGILLILDEVQCGMGRTGRLFAHEWAGVEPDIMCVAKGIGGGFPIGACLATARAASGMTVGTHGSTYGGNPLGCAVGVAVLETMLEDGFLGRVRAAAGRLRQGLEGLVSAYPDTFEAVRGDGLMLGVVCRVPVGEVVRAGQEARVLVVPAAENTARLLPPLTITDDEIDEGLRRLARAAESLKAAAA